MISNSKTKRLQAYFIGWHTEGENSECLYVALIFPSEGPIDVSVIENIELGGIQIATVPELITCHTYVGDQTDVDEMLLEKIPNWTDNYFFRDIAYLAIKAKYDPMFDGVEVYADVTFTKKLPLGFNINSSSIQEIE